MAARLSEPQLHIMLRQQRRNDTQKFAPWVNPEGSRPTPLDYPTCRSGLKSRDFSLTLVDQRLSLFVLCGDYDSLGLFITLEADLIVR